MKSFTDLEQSKKLAKILSLESGDCVSEDCSGIHLCGITHFAKIDGFFPELVESREEKIRKALIRFHRSTIDIDGIRGDKIVSWLERQGEQKSNPCDGCINRKGCINCENGELREVEQKPTDEEMKELLQTEYEKGRADAIAEMQNPAWSEKDERILQGIWDEILANKHNAKECEWKTYDKFLDWLKSLKNRVQPKHILHKHTIFDQII